MAQKVKQPGVADPKAVRLVKLHDQKKGERSNWESHYREALKYTIPSMDNVYFSRTDGAKENTHLYDGTGGEAVVELAAAMQSLTSNPAAKWFEFTTGNPKLDLETEVIKYLQDVGDIIHDILAGSNFYSENLSNLMDVGILGTTSLFAGEDDVDIVRFKATPIYEVYPRYDIMGRVYDLSREVEMDYGQLERRFGADKLKELDANKDAQVSENRKYKVIHYIEATKNKGTPGAFDSNWVLRSPSVVLEEKIFHEMPYACPRFMVMPGESLGRSPSMMALPDLKTLNSMAKTVLQGAQLAILPPVNVTDRGLLRPLKMVPSGVNYTRKGSEIKPITLGANPQIGVDLLSYYEGKVRKKYFLDKLQIASNDRMTATEIVQRRDENFRGVSPIFVRWDDEYTKPTISRVFAIAGRKGKLPKAPAALANNRDLGIKYTSVMAQAQLAGQAENLNRVFANTAPILEAKPEAWDLFNADTIIKGNIKRFSVEGDFLNSDAKVKEIRKARAEAQAAAAEQQEQLANAETVNKITPAMKGGEV